MREAHSPGGAVRGAAGSEELHLLEVRGLRHSFTASHSSLRGTVRGRIQALRGVCFHVRRSETLALVGESGSGKTTVALAVLRLLRPEAGEILFDGEDVGKLEGPRLRNFRRRAQIVFQDPIASLNPRLTVEDTLGEVLRIHGVAAESAEREGRIVELLEAVGLRREHRDRFPHELSGGQRQRVGIARALATEPEFLVLDEPVTALDVSVQAQVLNLLLDLQERLRLTYLFIAHDLSVVAHVADRVAVMYLGRIVEEGRVEDVFQDPLHPYTRALMAASPRPEPGAGRVEFRVLGGEPPSPLHPPPGCAFFERCPHPGRDAECRSVDPDLWPAGAGRWAACHKVPPGAEGGG